MVEDSPLQCISLVEQQACGNVGAVRITNRYDTVAVKTVFGGRPIQEFIQVLRALHEIFYVEYAFSETTEKSWHAVLQYISANAEHIRCGRDHLGQRQEILLIPRYRAVRLVPPEKFLGGKYAYVPCVLSPFDWLYVRFRYTTMNVRIP